MKIPFSYAFFCSIMTLAICLYALRAEAHVIISPQAAAANSYQTFSVSVPAERDAATIGLRLVIPDGVQSVRPTVKPGWTITTKKEKRGDVDVITELSWTGNQIPAGFRDDFGFSIQTPVQGSLVWKAYQTYKDGTVVAWDQEPAAHDEHGTSTPFDHETSTSGPYSVTTLSASAHSEHGDAEANPHAAHNDVLLPLLAIAISFGTFLMVIKKC